MLAECFTRVGYHAGDELIPPGPSNPHGFFEDQRINRINDELLRHRHEPMDDVPDRLLWAVGHSPATSTRAVDDTLIDEMTAVLPPSPSVVKDPRMSFTLPFWRPLIRTSLVVVMVRAPAEVLESLAAMAAREPEYFDGLVVDETSVGRLWASTYDSILRWADSDTVFVADSTVRDGSALDMLSARTGAPLSAGSVDHALHRQRTERRRSLVTVPSDLWDEIRRRCVDDLTPR